MASRESIAELAYHLWVARGQPHGSHDQDWLEAERRLGTAQVGTAQDSGRDSGTDGDPSNAQRPAARTGRKPRGRTASTLQSAAASGSAAKATRSSAASRAGGNPPVDETDDGPRSAPHDIGEG